MKVKSLVKTIIGVVIIGGGVGYFIFQAAQSSMSYYYSVDQFASGDKKVEGYLKELKY